MKKNNSLTSRGRTIIKNSDKLCCEISENGLVLISHGGYIMFVMTLDEYDTAVRPITHLAAGNWFMDKWGQHPFDHIMTGITDKAISDTADKAPLTKCPVLFETTGGKLLCSYYSITEDFVAFFNSDYIAALGPDIELKMLNPCSPAVVYKNGNLHAVVMPCRMTDKHSRVVKTYFDK